MELPVGFSFMANLCTFISFLPFFFFLFILGLLKATIICPIAAAIIVIGNSAVIIGLWIAHVVWTYYCVTRTKRFGIVLKIVMLICLPVPLFVGPIVGIAGSLLGGVGYGFFSPLLATFEAAGNDVVDKFHHCIMDGCWSTIERSCMVVQDLTDFCFHSYFSYMDELRENLPPDEKPLDVRLSLLPSCLLVIMVGVPVDVILITSIAIWKSPYMLFRGWKRLLEDLIGREGPFSETMCVPFAGIAIILWPLAVVGAILAACLSSLFLGLYSGLVVHQEDSIKMGFAYIVSVVSLFDEYVNDLLYLREGSCLPRPKYRKKMAMIQTHEQNNFGENDGDNMKCKMEVNPIHEYRSFGHNDNNDTKYKSDNTQNSRFISQQTRNLKGKFQQYRPVQVWDWLFRSCEINGRILLRDGVISFKDVEECLMKGNCKTLTIKLPAWTILHCLLTSAKSNSDGLVISDDIELTRMNKPRDKVFEWFYGPLLIMKEQLKNLELKEWEEICLKELALKYKNEIPEEWDGSEFQSNDNVRRAQLQAIIRRLQGIVVSLSRIPTFCRRIRNLVKVLYIEALHARASGSHIGGHVSTKYSGNISIESTNADLDKSSSNVNHRACQDENLV